MKYTKSAAGKKVTKKSVPELPSAFDLFKPSIEAVKLNIWTFITLLLVPTGLDIAYVIAIPKNTNGQASMPGAALIVLGLIILMGIVIAPALLVTQLASSRSEQIEAGEALKTGIKYLGRLILLDISLTFIILIGFVLLIIPGFILLKRYILAPYAMIDENLGVKDSLKRSAELTKHGGIWGIFGVFIIIVAVGLIPFIGQAIGFVADLAYTCALSIRYFQLRKIPANN